MTRTTEKGT